MPTCSHCGKENEEGAVFCDSCAAPFTTSGQTAPAYYPAPPRQPYPPQQYPPQGYAPQPGPYGPRPPYYGPPPKQSKAWLWALLSVGLVIILFLVVAIAIPVFFSARESAVTGACQDNLRTINSAAMTYSAATGHYPSSISELVPNYMRKMPECPDGGSYTLSKTNPPHAVCPNGHTY